MDQFDSLIKSEYEKNGQNPWFWQLLLVYSPTLFATFIEVEKWKPVTDESSIKTTFSTKETEQIIYRQSTYLSTVVEIGR